MIAATENHSIFGSFPPILEEVSTHFNHFCSSTSSELEQVEDKHNTSSRYVRQAVNLFDTTFNLVMGARFTELTLESLPITPLNEVAFAVKEVVTPIFLSLLPIAALLSLRKFTDAHSAYMKGEMECVEYLIAVSEMLFALLGTGWLFVTELYQAFEPAADLLHCLDGIFILWGATNAIHNIYTSYKLYQYAYNGVEGLETERVALEAMKKLKIQDEAKEAFHEQLQESVVSIMHTVTTAMIILLPSPVTLALGGTIKVVLIGSYLYKKHHRDSDWENANTYIASDPLRG